MSRRNRDVIMAGASAGGVEAQCAFAAGLPALPALVARGGEALTPGQILVGSPDHHLVVVNGLVAVAFRPGEEAG